MKSFILLSAIFASVSGQIFIRPSTTTTRSPVNSFTMPALSANERVYCEILKPQGSAGFLKGSGSFSLKLTLVKEGLVSIDIAAENKTSFIGRKILQRTRAQFLELCTQAENPQDGVVHVGLLPKTWQGALMM
jgi:hypothetical protein